MASSKVMTLLTKEFDQLCSHNLILCKMDGGKLVVDGENVNVESSSLSLLSGNKSGRLYFVKLTMQLGHALTILSSFIWSISQSQLTTGEIVKDLYPVIQVIICGTMAMENYCDPFIFPDLFNSFANFNRKLSGKYKTL